MGRFPWSLYDVTFSNLFACVEAVGFACVRRFSYLALEPEEPARSMPLTTSASTATNPISSRSIQQKTHLELFRYRWYNYISIRHDDCEKQVFDPAVSGISDGNEPMRDGLLPKCNAFDGAIVRPLMKAQHPPHGAVYYFLTA
jgi:hypothetical protein